MVEKAGNNGNLKAQKKLGNLYYDGNVGIPQRLEEGIKWYTMTAEQGCVKSQLIAANYYLSLGDNHNMSVENSYLSSGNPSQLCRDVNKGYYYYSCAAEIGDPVGQASLGQCYYEGLGVSRSHVDAFYWAGLAVEQGFEGARNLLGLCYEASSHEASSHESKNKKHSSIRDTNTSRWTNTLSTSPSMRSNYESNTLTNAMSIHSYNYNEHQAFECYRIASEDGDSHALYNLGRCYFNGVGTKTDKVKACECFKILADTEGDAPSQFYVGYCLANGIGVELSKTHAKRYYELAIGQGCVDAEIALKKLF